MRWSDAKPAAPPAQDDLELATAEDHDLLPLCVACESTCKDEDTCDGHHVQDPSVEANRSHGQAALPPGST